MKKKFEFNKEIKYFTIDPAFVEEGLREARGKYDSIRIMPLDHRTKNLGIDIAALGAATWIVRLNLHHDLQIPKDEFRVLERLVNLEELSLKEYTPLDYGRLSKLKRLTLFGGTDFPGLEKARSLELLYLSRWALDTLPDTVGLIAAPRVRISASRKLVSIEPIARLTHLDSLMMQDLPLLKVGTEANGLKSLRELHVEKTGWTDFKSLRSDSLRKLFATKVESLRFIKQLTKLEHLFFWDCVDGDLSPILEHPTLQRVDFTPERKHYTHKKSELRRLLAAKRSGQP